MLYREIIAVCSQIHTKHINTLCGQNVELLNVKLAVQASKQRRHEIWFVKIVNVASCLNNRAVLYLVAVYLTTPSTFQVKSDWKGRAWSRPWPTL